MLLHEDVNLFRDVINTTATTMKLPVAVVEKDYFVTMILRELSKETDECVFKGGTSLSKAHHVIDRFSEDIDISFSDKLTQGQRRKLKNETIAGISKKLNLPIVDWANARSKRDYNCYTFAYEPLEGHIPQSLIQGVKMEVALGTISFPTIEMEIDSYVYQYLKSENLDIVRENDLYPFKMKVQSIDRTLIDKVFAICDYYLEGKVKRNSRHLYDIYMLWPRINKDKLFSDLVREVRNARRKMAICPSAQDGVNVPAVLQEIIDKEVYLKDYDDITTYFQNKPVDYENTVSVIREIIETDIFGNDAQS